MPYPRGEEPAERNGTCHIRATRQGDQRSVMVTHGQEHPPDLHRCFRWSLRALATTRPTSRRSRLSSAFKASSSSRGMLTISEASTLRQAPPSGNPSRHCRSLAIQARSPCDKNQADQSGCQAHACQAEGPGLDSESDEQNPAERLAYGVGGGLDGPCYAHDSAVCISGSDLLERCERDRAEQRPCDAPGEGACIGDRDRCRPNEYAGRKAIANGARRQDLRAAEASPDPGYD